MIFTFEEGTVLHVYVFHFRGDAFDSFPDHDLLGIRKASMPM
jgi:hypothetical protein